MKEYHKIPTVYKRDPDNNFKTLLIGKYATPELEFLKDLLWVWEEKIDGTNIRVVWENGKIRYAGKTDNAQIPAFLLDDMNKMFSLEKMKKVFGEDDACLYGEGYGKKIQSGGDYNPERSSFILFDVKIGDFWLRRYDVQKIADDLEIEKCMVVGIGTLESAAIVAMEGFKSSEGDRMAEGLVMRPSVDLFDRKGNRIIAKIKSKDFPKKEEK